MPNAAQLCCVTPLLAHAACTDLATRLISDRVSLAVLGAGVLWRFAVDGEAAAALSLGVALAVFVVLASAFSRGWLGGGDVKLIAAATAGFAPAQSLDFLKATVVAGGVLGLVYMAAARITPTLALRPDAGVLRRVAAIESRRIGRRAPLPYALAIAAGFTFAFLEH